MCVQCAQRCFLKPRKTRRGEETKELARQKERFNRERKEKKGMASADGARNGSRIRPVFLFSSEGERSRWVSCTFPHSEYAEKNKNKYDTGEKPSPTLLSWTPPISLSPIVVPAFYTGKKDGRKKVLKFHCSEGVLSFSLHRHLSFYVSASSDTFSSAQGKQRGSF